MNYEDIELLTAVELLGDLVGAINGALAGQDPVDLADMRATVERVQNLLMEGAGL